MKEIFIKMKNHFNSILKKFKNDEKLDILLEYDKTHLRSSTIEA